jgi:putative endonuclease
VRQFHVYILASLSRRLYVGVTSNLVSRIYKHKNRVYPGFTSKYNIDRLMYFEAASNALAAIAREKQIKRWPRSRKIRLIELHDPDWRDSSVDWYKL